MPINLAEARDVVLPEIRSVSKISSFSHCAYSYYLERKVRVPQAPAWWFVGGRAFAETKRELEEMMANEVASQGYTWPSERDAERIYIRKFAEEIAREADRTKTDPKTWRAAAKGKEDGTWWWTAGPEMARLYVERNPSSRPFKTLVFDDGQLALEWHFLTSYGGVLLQGFIDHLTLDREGYVDCVDDKTGPKAPEDAFQLDCYAVAVEQVLGNRVARTMYYMARPIGPKAARQTPYITRQWDPERRDAVIARVAMMDKAERNGVYPPTVSNMCKGCSVRDSCAFGGTSKEIL